MKVLFAAPYIYDPGHPEFMKNATGYGYMVKDILDGVTKNNKTFLLTHQFSSGYRSGYIVLEHSKIEVIKNTSFKDIIKGIKRFFSVNACLGDRLRYAYYSIDKGYIKRSIRKTRPDIVHIHGLTLQTEPFIEACRELRVPFIVTLHGLNGLNNTTAANRIDREYEKNELVRLSKDKTYVSVVSSGIKDRIRNDYKLSNDNISVILNGTNFGKNHNPKEHEDFNIICIGNISKRKNQMQIVRAYDLLSNDMKNRVNIRFCGGNSENIPIDEQITRIGANEHIKYLGYVEREKMIDLWNRTDLNLVASIDEGFGLSIIEGFSYGIPTLTFSDLDAVKDLNNNDAMLTVQDRSDEALKDGIIAAVEKKWNKDMILKWSENFSMKKIVKDYEELYCLAMKRFGEKHERK